MGGIVYPTEEGVPICARPEEDGLPCLREVMVPGTPCHEHRGLGPIDAETVSWEPSDPRWVL